MRQKASHRLSMSEESGVAIEQGKNIPETAVSTSSGRDTVSKTAFKRGGCSQALGPALGNNQGVY